MALGTISDADITDKCGAHSTGTRILPGDHVNIGRPLPSVTTYVLDHRGYLVPPGVMGEIYISGDQITRGYWNDEERSKAIFVPNPFSTSHRVMYRSRDLGLWNEDMILTYIGRIDNQVKVRGFRVELEEIERAILSEGSDEESVPVKSAATITIADAQDKPHRHHLDQISKHSDHQQISRIVAFVTPQNVSTSLLHRKLKNILPSYARPSQIIAVPSLPESPNFKVDRKALRALAISAWSTRQSTRLYDQLAEPLSPTEQLIADIWKTLLGLEDDSQFHKDQDFFSIGGNSVLSIKAARMIASAVDRPIPVALLIRRTILGDLAGAIDQHLSTDSLASSDRQSFFSYMLSRSLEPCASPHESNAGAISCLEEEVFSSHNNLSDSWHVKSALHTVVRFQIQGPLCPEALIGAFVAVQRENPVLRSRFTVLENGRPSRLISDKFFTPICYSGESSDAESLEILMNKPFDLGREPLMRVSVRKEAADRAEVTVVTHHIITDKASLAIMFRWVSERYRFLAGLEQSISSAQISNSQDTGCPTSAKGTYMDWVEWCELDQQNPHALARTKANMGFWKYHLRNISIFSKTTRVLPLDHTELGLPSRGAQNAVVLISPVPAIEAVLPYSQRLAVSATALSLHLVFAAKDMVLGVPYLNRDEPGVSDMMGLFVDLLPLRMSLREGELADARALLASVTEELNVAIDHRLPYTHIQSAAGSVDKKIIDAVVLYHWEADDIEKSVSFGPEVVVTAATQKTILEGDSSLDQAALWPIQFEFNEQPDGGLCVNVEYDPRMISPTEIKACQNFLPKAIYGLAKGQSPAHIISLGCSS